jgi:uncharacterized protein
MTFSAKFLKSMEAYDNDDEALALQLMSACAEENDAAACFTLAVWYRNGEGTPIDLKLSQFWLTRHEELAQLGDIDAQWNVGQNYRFGNLLPIDIEKANYWLEKAAEAGCGEAQHHLAWFYETGQYGYPIDSIEAKKWYQSAFALGNPETLYIFAIRLFREGKPTDEAIRLLQLAADKGFIQAEHCLREHMH